jgi:Spy/CpxP family protein refolding chaperone
MTPSMRHRSARTSVLVVALIALPACGGGEGTAPPPAAPSAMASAAPPPAPVAPVAPPPSAAPVASAAPSAQPAPAPNPTGAEVAEGDEHRHRHHGGALGLLVMSLRDLDLTAEQRTAVEKIRADLVAKLEPARTAEKDLGNVLADGVAAGAVNRAKADAAIGKLVTQVQGLHDASLAALDQLHKALTPAQRAALVDAMQAHWEKWKEAQGHDEADEHHHQAGYLLALVRDLGLSKDQAEKIKAKFREGMKATPQDDKHKEVQDHLQAFATAFKSDSFSAKSLTKAKAANGHLAKWGATRRARFLEAAAPVLTPDQRTKLADQIRERANRADE